MRPHPTPVAYGLLGAAIAMWTAAARSPAPWLGLLGAGLAAAVVVGAVVPAILLRTFKAGAILPRDAVAGRPLTILITSQNGGIGDARLIDPPTGWSSEQGTVEATFARRGLVPALVAEVRTGAPLGLVWWTRRITLDCPEPVAVAPREIPFTGSVPPASAREAATAAGSGITRGLREYRHGDPQRLVHWAATARTGEVMVRELDSPDEERVEIVADLAGPLEASERAAERAAALTRASVAAGRETTLVTVEAHGVVCESVGSALEIGRRLARAETRAIDPGTVGDGAIWVRA